MNRRSLLAGVAGLLALPALWTLGDAVTFHLRDGNNGSIVVGGMRREYLLHVPPGYDGSRPVPLVVSLHGAGGWPAQQRDLSRWDRVADREGFIVVYPAGSGVPRVWQDDGRDVRFISDLIDRIEESYNIDRTRIYANGFSNGGGMTFVLSCALSDRIAAVGLAGAALLVPWSRCTDRRPVPMIAVHGTADPFALYNGGDSPIVPDGARFQSVPLFAATWARRNGCAAPPVDAAVAADVIRREYTNCSEGADVILYSLRGAGHQWFGGGPLPEWFVGPQSNTIDATERMWSFFVEHPLRKGSR